MCLMLTVRLADADAARGEEIRQAADLPACTQRRRLFSSARRPSAIMNIPGPGGGCGCGFLADSADWDAPTWDMLPDTLPRLAEVLQTIRQHTTAGFLFETSWNGERATDERHVTIGELVALVERSQLGTKTRYVVE